MCTSPIISIITVTLNAAELLEKTIKSVASQTVNNKEYIVIDGGSSDGSTEVIERYGSAIDVAVSELDSGIYDAMNKGVSIANGRWVIFLNAGDTFYNNSALQDVISLDLEGVDVIYCDTNIVDENFNNIGIVEAEDLSNLMVPKMPFCHQSSLVKKSLLTSFPFRTDYRLASDLDFFIRLYIKNHNFSYIKGFVLSNFVKGGLHSKNMIKYVSEGVNSIYELHPEPREYTNNLGAVHAFEELNQHYSESFFPSLLSKTLGNAVQIFEQNSSCVIYGNGLLGNLLYRAYQDKVVAVVDKYSTTSYVRRVNELADVKFDVIVISVVGREQEIRQDLISSGIPHNKIKDLSVSHL